MSKYANSGELRTKVFFKSVERTTDDDAFPKEEEVNVFGKDDNGADIPVRVKWVNAHGTEVFTAMQLRLREPTTITMRYCNPCLLYIIYLFASKLKNRFEDNSYNLSILLAVKPLPFLGGVLLVFTLRFVA